MTTPFRATLAACTLALLLPSAVRAQTADRPLARSPIALHVPLLPLARHDDRRSTAVLLQGGGGHGTGALSLGVDFAAPGAPDSAGVRAGTPLVVGAALGFAPSSDRLGPHLWTAAVHAGGLSPAARLGGGVGLRTGLDVAVGLTDLSRDPTTSLGLRLPVALTRAGGGRRVAAFVAPGIGWGRFGVRRCTDDGPSDGCGDLGVQVHSVRREWLLAGGVDMDVVPGRVRLTAGAQRMLARGERTRVALGLGWEP